MSEQYTINLPLGFNGTSTQVVVDPTIIYPRNNKCSLILVGKDALNYGAAFAENTLRILSHNASNAAGRPTKPLIGELWYNADTKQLMNFVGVGTAGADASGWTGVPSKAASLASGTPVVETITFKNDGTGAASGSVYGGTAPLVISYNTIGAAPANGTGTSGTWGINITGNAATASKLTPGKKINGVTFDGTTDITLEDDTKLPLTGGKIENGNTPSPLEISRTAATVQQVSIYFRTTDGTTTYGAYLGTSSGILKFAPTTNLAAGSTVLLDSNFNTYSPTLTGGGASGLWGISVTGNAATATKLQTARTINSVNFDGSSNILINLNNSLTFNSAGGGAASGSTFNGSAATTISYNTIGAPSVTGANASGSWNINAATATKLQTARKINGIDFDGSGAISIGLVHGVAFNDSGTGVAPGTAFYANAPITVSYNTLGAPSKTGDDASGSWGISVTGNAATATKLQTAQTLAVSGDATGSTTFDGSASKTIALTLAASGITAGTYSSITVDAKGRATAGGSILGSTAALDADSSGAAGTATTAARSDHRHPYPPRLATSRTIELTGAVTGSATFNGAANASIATTLGGFDVLKAQDGYQKLPGGLIIQWGRVDIVSNGTSYTFPIAFPTACASITLTGLEAGSGAEVMNPTALTRTGFTASATIAATYCYIAIGY